MVTRISNQNERHVTSLLIWHAVLRRGAIDALDVGDYDAEEMSPDVRHRPETGTPIKNKFDGDGERFIALSAEACSVLDAWLANRRPDTVDEYGRTPSSPLRRAGRISPRFRAMCTR